MNRWEVQFLEIHKPLTVTAPSAADAIVIAASALRRRFGFFVDAEAMRVPWGIAWRGPAAPTTDTMMPGPADPLPEPTPWKCNICGVMHGPSTVDAHRHEDDPRSTYYVAPHKDNPTGAT